MTKIITDNTIITVYEKNDGPMSLDEIRKTPLSDIQAELMDEQNRKLEEEFEETVRGELMNLKLVQKYLLSHIHGISKLDMDEDISRAIKIIDSDVTNLEKFVEERWGE